MTSVDAPAKAGWREWVGLAVLCLPTMLATIDVNVMFLALPHVSADLGASSTEELWITDIYGFMIAGFLVTMGTLGDRFGRRRVLLYGAAAFVVASLLTAYSNSTGTLIASRALLGVAGATVMPSVLALISTMFKNPKEMGAAMGVWGTSIMVGVVLGPVVGGLLLGAFWWGAIFLIAVPVMGLLLLVGPALLPESRNPNPGRLDLASVGLSLAAILPLIYGLKEVGRIGWQPMPGAGVMVGGFCLLLFIERQKALSNPLLDLRLFRIRTLSAALVLGLSFAFVMGGLGFQAALFMQMVKGYSAFQVGLWMLAPSIAMVPAIGIATNIARKVRPGYVLGTGAVIAAAGTLVITQVDPYAGMATLVTGLIIVFVGGAAVGPLTPLLIMSSAPKEKAGAAGALQSTAGEFGIALGIAILGLISNIVYRFHVKVPAGLPIEQEYAARFSMGGADWAADKSPGPIADAMLVSAREAYTVGMNAVAGIAAALLIGVAILAVFGLRHIPPTGTPPGAGQAGSAPAEPAELDAPRTGEMVHAG